MRLLFEENLSPKLVRLLDDLFPNSLHVRDVDLESENDCDLELCEGEGIGYLFQGF